MYNLTSQNTKVETPNLPMFATGNQLLTLLQINIRGINNLEKLDCFTSFVESLRTNVDVIVVGETMLKQERCQYYNIAGFSSVHSCRNQSSGGLAMFIRDGMDYTIKKNISHDGYHHIEMSIKLKHKTCTIHGVYRPPDNDLPRLLAFVEGILATTDPMCPTFILGDINVAVNKPAENDVLEYLNVLASYNMCVTNTVTTRPLSNNILDHVIARTDDADHTHNYTIDCDLSDHSYILTQFKSPPKLPHRVTLTKPKTDYSSVKCEFEQFLQNTQWEVMEPNLRLATIANVYREIKHAHTTVVTVEAKLKKGDCPWFTLDVWVLIQVRDNALQNWKADRQNPHLRELLDRANKLLAAAKRKAKRDFHSKLFNTNNAKLLWKRINEVLGKNSKQDAVVLKVNESEVAEPTMVATHFNDYFTTIGAKLAEQLTSTRNINEFNTIKTLPRMGGSFFLFPAAPEEIARVIKTLDPSKAVGHDGFPVTALKQHSEQLSKILASTFNDSVTSGTYPEHLKEAIVHPIFKGGDPTQMSNYRPISVLPSMNKIFETLLSSRLTKFLSKHKFFYEMQYGFRKGSCTEVAVLDLVNDISEVIDQKQKVAGSIFLDLAKAFDTIDHELLLDKLNSYGVRGLVNDLLRSYLCNRRQKVSVNGNFSPERCINCGVPQGSNVGPLLFLIYINDMARLKLHGRPRLFADDTVVTYRNGGVLEMVSDMTDDLAKINAFLENNLLSLNAKKTKIMFFRGSRMTIPPHPNVEVKGCCIDEVETFKYLGIHLDSTLTWKIHIENLVKSNAPLCGMFRKLSHFLPRHVLMKVYYSFVHSRYQFGVSIWGSACASHLKTVQIQQNRCLKAILKLPFLFPTLELYNSTLHNALPIAALHELQTTILTHRMVKLKDIHHNFEIRMLNHQRGMRIQERLVVPRFRTELGRRRFCCNGPRMYNNLPGDLKTSDQLLKFKQKVKFFIRANLARYL